MQLPEAVPPIIRNPIDRHSDLRRIVRYLLAGNPFFVFSAVLLLYAMRRLSFDPRLFSTEVSQLLFNFGSFQFYEILLVGTAVLLARKRIWYDSTLLVFIETMFAFVPLILVSQALLVENSIAAILCVVGAALFVIRTGSLAKFIKPLNFPGRLLAIASMLLVFNVGVPILTRHMHRELTLPKWDEAATLLANVEWFVVAPLLVLLALLLPRTPKDSPAYFSRAEFPLLTVLLWIAGTAVHVYCINYVYGLPTGMLRLALTAPMVWTACWVLWVRADDVKWLYETTKRFYETALLTAAAAMLAIPAFSNDHAMLLALGMINVVLFAVLAIRAKSWYVVLLLSLSAAATFSALGISVRGTATHPTHIHFIPMLLMTIGAFLLVRSIISRDARFGFLGGFLTVLFATHFYPSIRDPFMLLQIGVAFVVLHSVRWDDKLDRHSKHARMAMLATWIGNSFAWLCDDGTTAFWGVFISGVVVFVAALIARCVAGHWTHLFIPISALAAMILPPGFKAVDIVAQVPTGLIILLASFLLFAVGIMTALARSRWLAHSADRRVVTNL